MILCGLYYIFWMHLLPKWRGYKIRSQVLDIDGDSGANTHRLLRVPVAEVAEWDAKHDEQGRLRRRTAGGVVSEENLATEGEKSVNENVSKV